MQRHERNNHNARRLGCIMSPLYRSLRRVQRDSHLVSRTAGDAAAAMRGPGPLAKRVGRRMLTRWLFRLFGNGAR